MPRTRSLAWAELKFGMIAVFAIVMAGLLIFAVGGSGGFFWQNYTLKAQFPNVAGLLSGSPVRIAGVEVGSVSAVQLLPTGAEVWFSVRNDMRSLVTDRSMATIGSISLLGEGAVDIEPGPGGTPVPEWGYVRSGIAEGSIAQVTSLASDSILEARKLVEGIRRGDGTIGKLFTDESLYRDFDALVMAAERVTTAIASGKGTVGKLTSDPRLYDEMQQSIANLSAITAKVRNGEGSLGQLLNDPALARSVTTATANIESMTARLNKGEGTAGKLLTDDALYQRIDGMTARLDAVLRQLSDGEGTAGQLLRDKRLYENMNQTVAEIQSLVTAIRNDPKKYLNVKVSIF